MNKQSILPRLITLPNGVRVAIYQNPGLQSVAMGIFTFTGLNQEPDHLPGISHFLEHMCFKGIPGKSAKEIAEVVDFMGGNINAFTDKDRTAYHLTVLPEYYLEAFELLSDLYLNPTLEADELEKEKFVVQEEISMVEDTPDDLIHDLFSQNIWQSHKLGNPILGTKQSVQAITQKELKEYHQHYARPESIVVSIAGNIPNESRLLKEIEDRFGNLTSSFSKSAPMIIAPTTTCHLQHRDTEQTHICLGTQTMGYGKGQHFARLLLGSILGGSMSSRLFQEVREKLGLAYSVYSYQTLYQDLGAFIIYAGIHPKNLEKTMHVILEQLQDLSSTLVTGKEVQKAKSLLKGSLTIHIETASSWMSWMARTLMYIGSVSPPSEIMPKIDEIESETIRELAQTLFQPERLSLAGIGPFTSTQLEYHEKPTERFLTQLG